MTEHSRERVFWDGEMDRFLPDARQALREAARHVCCPVCYVVADVPFRYFAQLPIRWAGDEQLRETVHRSRGFCNSHTWRLSRMQGLKAISQIMISVLEAVPSPGETPQLCPVCRLQLMVESVVLDDFRDWLGGSGAHEHYGAMFGLCYPHLDQTLERGVSDDVEQLLRHSAETRRANLLRDLRSFVEKDTPGRRSTRTDAEVYAPRKVLQALAGNQES